MPTFKRLALFALLGASVLTAIAALITPGILEWYSAPVVPTAVDCTPAVAWAMRRLVQTEAAAAVLGGIGAPLVAWLIGRGKPAVPAATPPAGAGPVAS